MNMQEWMERFNQIRSSIESGAIERDSASTLAQYNSWLAHGNAPMHFSGNYAQVCETVRLHLLRIFMEELERRNSLMTKVVLVLTVVSVITGGIQAYAALVPAKQEPVATQLAPAPPPAQNIPAVPQSRPAEKPHAGKP